MLPSTHRLPKEVVSDVLRFGARKDTGEFTLRYKKTSDSPRFAIVVSTKVDKRATQRNRIRRIISESLARLLSVARQGDYVVVVRKNIADLSQKEVEALLAPHITNEKTYS